MSSSRYVDTVPAPDPELVKEKRVIVLSYSRSGTLGLCNAMQFLGYKPYNMHQVVQNGYSHIKMFSEALQIKRTGQGKPYSRPDFDKWMWNYDVLTIVPCYLTEEIVQAYPDAKFILTVREPENWAKSVWNTIGLLAARAHSFPANFYKYFDLADLQFSRLVDLIFQTITRGYGRTEAGYQAAMKEYEEYNARVKDLVPADRLLIAKLEEGLGWEQICPFLEVDIPEVPYPRMNDTKQFQAQVSKICARGRRNALSLMGALSALAIGVWSVRR
ncbi:P-loop containing nucleoside triphosphate hydrolase protein [Xylaria bambusicola]|uniref:P-loop containing nucleoside triphosphate hydrolase protein n=1 Tax=Xylaria bambusicola TaxID=326684 RepID=UPI002007AD94|nr:P-loop containing nucleoside triphosphate hydrolase protein [Xylaria bambusicola]KAI0509067.1 P-loop containing nucleoside triphosphate hydrolase protein [Xylaria bambusicola]